MCKYEASYGSDQKWYVSGAGKGMGYHSGTLYPELRFDTEERANQAALVANIAYQAGIMAAKFEIRSALGMRANS